MKNRKRKKHPPITFYVELKWEQGRMMYLKIPAWDAEEALKNALDNAKEFDEEGGGLLLEIEVRKNKK